MLAKRIIPCLDVKDGRLVKGERFVNFRDAGDPVKMAAHYDKEGADEIVLFDITASARGAGSPSMWSAAAEEVFVPFTVGGGVGSAKEMRMILAAGADKVSVNSAAVKNPDIIREGAKDRQPAHRPLCRTASGAAGPTASCGGRWSSTAAARRQGWTCWSGCSRARSWARRGGPQQHRRRRDQQGLRQRIEPDGGRAGGHPGDRLGRGG